MKRIGYCLIRFLSALLGWLITCILILPVIPAWGSEGFRFFPWLLSILALIVIPLVVAYLILICIPLSVDLREHYGAEHADEAQPNADSFDSNTQIITTEEDLAAFLASHDVIADIHTKVVGVTYNNKDGSSRQRNISFCHSGDMLTLEFFTYKGKPAYAVFAPYGQIGNLSADLAEAIDSEYDGCTVLSTVKNVTGGHSGYPYGCNIQLIFYREKSVIEPDPVRSHRKSPKTKPQVSDAFIAEAQWYASRDESNDT